MDGAIQYGLKNGRISQTNPGVFYYYSGSQSLFTADGGSYEVLIDQTVASPKVAAAGIYEFSPQVNGVDVFRVVDGELFSVPLPSGAVSVGNGNNTIPNGDITIDLANTVAGSSYVFQVKYSTGSIVGLRSPDSSLEYSYIASWDDTDSGLAPDVVDSAATVRLDPKGVGVQASPNASVSGAGKKQKLRLDGAPGMGGDTLSGSELDRMVSRATAYWMSQDISAAQMERLQAVDVVIGRLDGRDLGYGTSDGVIHIDDDAAGHGWSMKRQRVERGRVDLLSVVAHEMGHALGMDDTAMGSTLAIGDRRLPLESPDRELQTPFSRQLQLLN
jgi:hypothetical protein